MSDGSPALNEGRAGPLSGVRVLEVSGVGPGPFGTMMLADMGADVLRIERAGAPPYTPPIDPAKNALHRGRRSLTLNLKDPPARALLLRLCEAADVLTEGFRPGVMERLGVGPDICLQRNPSLIYARMTGWGQTGPLAAMAGHDINYFGLSGSLALCGPAGGGADAQPQSRRRHGRRRHVAGLWRRLRSAGARALRARSGARCRHGRRRRPSGHADSRLSRHGTVEQ